jgi:hypothetical protein
MKLKLTISVIVIATILITGCGGSNTPQTGEPTPDVAVVRTSAASTVVSQFTLTAAAFTPTPSQPIEPTISGVTDVASTATSTTQTQPAAQVTNALGTSVALCDSLTFVADVNVPDDTNMSPGQDFIKTWRVKNTGSCPWGEGYELVYAEYENEMSGQPQPLTEVVQPGQEVEISVQFTAPDQIGNYLSAWQMENPAGVTFEDIIFVKIIVQ